MPRDVVDRAVDDRVDRGDVTCLHRGIAACEVREGEHGERTRHEVPLWIRAAQLGDVTLDVTALPQCELANGEGADLGIALEPAVQRRDPDQRGDDQAGNEAHVAIVATQSAAARILPVNGRNR